MMAVDAETLTPISPPSVGRVGAVGTRARVVHGSRGAAVPIASLGSVLAAVRPVVASPRVVVAVRATAGPATLALLAAPVASRLAPRPRRAAADQRTPVEVVPPIEQQQVTARP